MSKNNLESLSEDVIKLTNLKRLRVGSNKLLKLPSVIWKMNNLELIQIEDNPWNENWKGISGLGLKDILLFCRKREPINILLFLGKNDENDFNIEELRSFLTSRKEISRLTSFSDLSVENTFSKSPNLDEFHLVIFYASQDSLFNSMIFKDMIKLVKEQGIQIIPIKGPDVSWGDLAEVELSRELGLEHTKEAFHQFCEDLYDYIVDFKHSVDLIDREQGKFDKSLLEFRTIMKDYVNQSEFKDVVIEYIDKFTPILNQYKSGGMTQLEFIQQFGMILRDTTN